MFPLTLNPTENIRCAKSAQRIFSVDSKFLYKRKVNWGIDGHAFCIQELIQKWVQQTEHPIKIAICLEDSDILCSFARAMATQANLQTAGYGLA